MSKFKKTLLLLFSFTTIVAALIIIFISPITKYLVEKYDEKYTGRQITMDQAYVNPFTGYVRFDDLIIKEFQSDSIFLSLKGVSANFEMFKMLFKTYEISELVLDQPKGMILQNGDKHDLNFKDIIEKFTPKKTHKVRSPLHFSILKININDGEFYYRENITPISYFIKSVNIESNGIHWDTDTIAFRFSFLSGIGNGDMKGNFTINSKNQDYRFAVVANKYDLQVLEQYLKDMANYGNFSANLDADLNAKGNFNSKEDITIKGMLSLNDFRFGKNPKEDYTSFEKMLITINELSPKNHKYSFDSIALTHPYFKYERYDHLDNFQTMFGKKGSKISAATGTSKKFNLIIEIARYVKVLAKNFLKSNYEINRVAIYKGDLKFNDYSLGEKFSVELDPLYFTADSINRKYKRVNAFLKSGVKPYGYISIALSINPKDSSDFDMYYNFQKISASIFNPYLISYTSFPLDRGTIELHGTWNVRNGMIQSINHLVLIDPRLNNRIKNKAARWIPMRLLMYFVRETGNVIDYEIPITGNLKNPKFHLKDVAIDAVKNIFIKPATTPYRLEVKNMETEIEKTLVIKWEMRSSTLEHNQEIFIKKMTDFLSDNPDVRIMVYPQHYTLKEKENILFFEAKKKYFLAINNKNELTFNEEDSVKINKMSIKDSCFVNYLNKHVPDPMLFTTQDKCARFLDSFIVNAKLNQLNKERAKVFMFYFKEEEVENQIKIHHEKSVIPYNGFSFYKIEYKDELPNSLMRAYQKMNQLNDEAPRKKFKKEREKNNNTL